MSLGPAQGRGGTGDALSRLRRKKAPQLSVVEEMSLPEPTAPETVPEVQPAAAVPETAAASVTELPVQPAPVTAPTPVPVVEPAPVPAAVAPAVEAPAPDTAAPAPVQQAPADVAAPAPAAQPAPAARKKPEKEALKKTGFWQTPEQWARTRSTYDSTRHLTGHRTMDQYLTAAVEMYDQFNEEKFNGGKPFESDPFGIPKGRPLGS